MIEYFKYISEKQNEWNLKQFELIKKYYEELLKTSNLDTAKAFVFCAINGEPKWIINI